MVVLGFASYSRAAASGNTLRLLLARNTYGDIGQLQVFVNELFLFLRTEGHQLRRLLNGKVNPRSDGWIGCVRDDVAALAPLHNKTANSPGSFPIWAHQRCLCGTQLSSRQRM